MDSQCFYPEHKTLLKKLRKISKLMDSARYQEGDKRQPEGDEAVFKHLNFVQLPCMFIFFLLCVVLLSWKEEENL